jgi:hypothetical protein
MKEKSIEEVTTMDWTELPRNLVRAVKMELSGLRGKGKTREILENEKENKEEINNTCI